MPDTAEQQFEWNDDKRLLAIEKHGIDFTDAIRIFDGRPTTYAPSSQNHPDDQRWITTGDLDGLMISVVWIYRDSKIRIITARRARKNEKSEFHKRYPR